MPGTLRLYLDDDHCLETEATVMAVRASEVACDRTCFYPGGGGQPPDEGTLAPGDGRVLTINSASADAQGCIWHDVASGVPANLVGQTVRLSVSAGRRLALARYHTVLHIVNTVALRDNGAWITGARIAVDYASIDFKWDGFSPALRAELEAKVNVVICANHPLTSYYLTAEDFAKRGDLVRTLEVKPPVVDGRVRVVEIAGFDAQACGGTHVRATGELGQFTIFRTENKGRINKRLYVRLHSFLP